MASVRKIRWGYLNCCHFKFLRCSFSAAVYPKCFLSCSRISGFPSYAYMLKEITELKTLQQIHARLIVFGLSDNIFLSNRLITAYIKFGLLTTSEKIFWSMPSRNVVSWTILISGYTKNGFFEEALEIFRDMKMNKVMMNVITIASILPAFANLGLIRDGRSVHGFIIRCNVEMNVYINTSLVDMYCKFARLDVARVLFDKMPCRNIISWNSIIAGFSNKGYAIEVLVLFKLMKKEGFLPDFHTIMGLLPTCNWRTGRIIHCYMTKTGLECDLLCRTALIDMYAKGEKMDSAYQVFDEHPVKDTVSWTLIISWFSEIGLGKKVVDLFNEMMASNNANIDSIALIGILSSCSKLGALQQGKRIHGLIIKRGFIDGIFIGTSLIDMYSNCGHLEDARNFFDQMGEKDVACWNAMITGSGVSGCGQDAIDLFFQMKVSGFRPNGITFISVLFACSHSGLVDKGLEIFHSMQREEKMIPCMQHYTCIVDLLGRSGRLNEAHSFVNNMPVKPNISVYGSLLSACRVHGNVDLGLKVSQSLFELKPDNAGYYVLLSNMFALAGRWEDVKVIRKSIKSRGLKKIPGFSSIEIHQELHEFVSGYRERPEYKEIDKLIMEIIEKIKEQGYRPHINVVLHDVSDKLIYSYITAKNLQLCLE